jgi:hypothetical protein
VVATDPTREVTESSFDPSVELLCCLRGVDAPLLGAGETGVRRVLGLGETGGEMCVLPLLVFLLLIADK